MTETLEKIQTIFQEAKNFALFSKRHAEDYKLLAKEALKQALSEKNLSVLSLPEDPDFQKKWVSVIPPQENGCFPQQTSIRIPKKQYKVKELICEEDNDFLSLVVTSENAELNKNEIIFEPILTKADAALCFFDPCDADTLGEFEKQLILPSKEKIIFIASGEKTFAEKISQIIKTVFPETLPLPQITTLLFASLITETNNFIRPVSQEVLRFGSELLSLGANKELVKNILNENKTISFARLLGRALARTHVDENFNTTWTFISQKDLEKTENPYPSHSFFYDIVRNLREFIPFRALSLLFWQNGPESLTSPLSGAPEGQKVFAMAAADEEKELIPLAQLLGVNLQSKFFTTGPFNNFSEAELRFRKALEEMNSLKI
jgi:hypothetical protein